MKITFVQNDKEKAESDRVIQAGISLRKLECSFRDPERMFVVTTSVQETEVR